MDIATACYLILPVALCTIVLKFREIPGLRKVLRPITAVFVVLSCIIHVCDIGLFTAWGTKVNHKADAIACGGKNECKGKGGCKVCD